MRIVAVPALLVFATFTSAHAQNAGYATGPAAANGPVVAALQPYLKQKDFAGAVVQIATKNKVLDTEAIGYADLATKTPMQSNEVFWIASMSKAITTTGMMMLVDEGKVKLDDPVEKYLPEFKGQMVQVDDAQGSSGEPRPDQNAAISSGASGKGKLVPAIHPITVREAMSHTAGLRFSSTIEKGHLDTAPLKDAVAQYGKDPLIYQPGTNWKYANEGINTTGRIIEVVSGMPLEKFLQQRLFTPMGMTDTTFWPNAEQISRLAKSYKTSAAGDLEAVEIDQLTYPLDRRANRFPMPAGGLFSTAIDVTHFCQMLLNGGSYEGKRYLSEAAVHAMSMKETPSGVKNPYGFGLSTGPRGFGHGGAYKTDMWVDVKDGLTLVFMVQKADKWTGKQPDEIRQIMRRTGESMLGVTAGEQ